MDDAESGAGENADRSLQWTTNHRENAYECPGFSIVHEEVTLPDGTDTDFDYLHDVPSVVILPFTPSGDLVVIEEWRQAVKRVTKSFPAGGVEPGEGLSEAAHRELTEETGYEAESIAPLETFEPATGIADATHHYFLATDCRPTGTQDLDEDESLQVTLSSLGELFADLTAGELRDGRTALGLLYYAIEQMDRLELQPPTSN